MSRRADAGNGAGGEPGEEQAAAPEDRSPLPPGGTRIPQSVLRRRALRRRAAKIVAIGTAVLVATAGGAAYLAYQKLDSNIKTDESTARMLGGYESQRPTPVVEKALNILLIGSDDRSGSNRKYGASEGSQRSDTTILLHLTADRRSATAMSIPRDLMADIPACRQKNGSETRAQHAQFNWAFQFGGAACTIRTVENMTDVRIDHHLIVDFTGFKQMVNAVGGVEVCLPKPVTDRDAKLDLPAGRQTVRGEDALAFVRARHSFGDGSDTQRMGRQQQFMASLLKKVKSNGVLLNPTKLYSLMDAATSSLTADAGLNSLDELYGLARTLQKTPTKGVVFLTVPREPYVNDPNRDQLVQPEAAELFAALREDRPVKVASSAHSRPGSPSGTASDSGAGAMSQDTAAPHGPSPDPTPSTSPSVATPGYEGTTANSDICGTS
ncbi:LCP family protein [Wenjunlia tyrosinilytica]|uniref:LCP family protein n=1 Tax=Wenjunlia tyrosinilytica TaxID=1544741 RepID=UPI001E645673|nr:LCP family protein [Wenjunlia tyrosinilytica]